MLVTCTHGPVAFAVVGEGDTASEPVIALAVEHVDTGAVVSVRGDLEFGTASVLHSTLIDLTHQGCNPLVLDLSELEFIDSTGLSLLVQAHQRIASDGHTFVLRNPTIRVQRVLEISGLAELFTIEPAAS